MLVKGWGILGLCGVAPERMEAPRGPLVSRIIFSLQLLLLPVCIN